MLFLFQWVQAQQQPNFLFFEQNMGIYNPAFTGSEGAFVGLGYRAAWSGIEDAPRATSLVYNTNEKNRASWNKYHQYLANISLSCYNKPTYLLG